MSTLFDAHALVAFKTFVGSSYLNLHVYTEKSIGDQRSQDILQSNTSFDAHTFPAQICSYKPLEKCVM